MSDVPTELEELLEQHPEARRAFERLAPSHQREWIKYVVEGKREKTRWHRAEKAVEALREGDETP